MEGPEEKSYYKMFIKNEQVLALTSNEEGIGKPKRWRRFEQVRRDDYRYLERDYADAVVFVPKKDIWFFGFGININYHSKDMKL